MTMTLPTYDIMKKEHNKFVWVEAAPDIQSAKKRVYELSRHGDAEFNHLALTILGMLGTYWLLGPSSETQIGNPSTSNGTGLGVGSVWPFSLPF